MRNNPLYNIDVLGDEVTSNRASVNTAKVTDRGSAKPGSDPSVQAYIAESERKLAGSLSEKTGLNLSFNESGKLQYAKDQDGKPILAPGISSESARNDLISLIDNKNFNYTVNWADGAETIKGGQSTIRVSGSSKEALFLDPSDFKRNNKFYDIGMVFLHEMNHGYYGLTDNYTCPEYNEAGVLTSYGQRGETVLRVNSYEEQLNYPIRISYCDMGEGAFFQQKTETIKKNGKIKTRFNVINAEF